MTTPALSVAGGRVMISFHRSIQFKILGVAIGLLAAMVAAMIFASQSTARVNRQLATFTEAMLPFALAAKDMRAAMLTEQWAILHREPGLCGAPFAGRSKAIQQQLAAMEAIRGHGEAIATLEVNRAKFIELKPLVAEIGERHGQLIGDIARLCASDGEDARIAAALARDRVSEIEHHIDGLSDDIAAFSRQSVDMVQANEQRALYANRLLVGIAALVGVYLAWLVARGLTRPIERLRQGALAVQSGDLEREVPVTTTDEIGDVTRAFNAMIGELRLKEQIKATFGRYIDPRIVSTLISADAQRSMAGQRQSVTIFFSDLVGFTPIADRLTPDGLVTLMNAYFTAMSEAIRAEHGIIDKYIGDAVMAFWTAPFVTDDNQSEAACRAALAQFDRLAEFRRQLPDLMRLRQDLPPIDIRIGLSSGEAVVGSIGSDAARNFTVMGDVVNAGSRLESANKFYGTHILIDQAVRDQAGAAIAVRMVDCVVLKGRSEASPIFELRGLGGDGPADELVERYDTAFAAYAAGDWATARSGFDACLAIAPTDGPARLLAARTAMLAADPPQGWSGVWKMETK